MPRKLDETTTLDEVEEEMLFTHAALRADPDAEPLLPLTEGWLQSLDAQRGQAREVRRRVAEVDATRIVCNSRFDQACVKFGDDLYLDVRKDRTSPRWGQFFNVAVSSFIRMSLPRQVARVRAWFQSSDPILTKHKPELERWTTKADEALVNTHSLALIRGEHTINRAQFAEDFTHDRDGLHAALMQRARELRLARDWANAFFRPGTRRNGEEETEVAPEGAATV